MSEADPRGSFFQQKPPIEAPAGILAAAGQAGGFVAQAPGPAHNLAAGGAVVGVASLLAGPR